MKKSFSGSISIINTTTFIMSCSNVHKLHGMVKKIDSLSIVAQWKWLFRYHFFRCSGKKSASLPLVNSFDVECLSNLNFRRLKANNAESLIFPIYIFNSDGVGLLVSNVIRYCAECIWGELQYEYCIQCKFHCSRIEHITCIV